MIHIMQILLGLLYDKLTSSYLDYIILLPLQTFIQLLLQMLLPGQGELSAIYVVSVLENYWTLQNETD